MSGRNLLCLSFMDAEENIHPGDVIAFAGEGMISSTIARFTDSPISHVGVVFGRTAAGELLIAESTSLGERDGSTIGLLTKRIQETEGGVYVLPLAEDLARVFRFDEFQKFLLEQNGKRYDFRSIFRFGVRKYAPALANRLPWFREDLGRVFCSELVTAALEHAGVLPETLNASAISPADVCEFGIYTSFYFQLKGLERAIPRFNSRSLQTLRAAA